MNTCYRKDTIRLWIERATGKATSTVDQGTCADIAQAMLMYNQLYEEEEKFELKAQALELHMEEGHG